MRAGRGRGRDSIGCGGEDAATTAAGTAALHCHSSMTNGGPDSERFEALSRELLRSGMSVRFEARGASMSPCIRDGEMETGGGSASGPKADTRAWVIAGAGPPEEASPATSTRQPTAGGICPGARVTRIPPVES